MLNEQTSHVLNNCCDVSLNRELESWARIKRVESFPILQILHEQINNGFVESVVDEVGTTAIDCYKVEADQVQEMIELLSPDLKPLNLGAVEAVYYKYRHLLDASFAGIKMLADLMTIDYEDEIELHAYHEEWVEGCPHCDREYAQAAEDYNSAVAEYKENCK